MASRRKVNRTFRNKSCGTKIKYNSLEEAQRASYFSQIKAAPQIKEQRLQSYYCTFCKNYHIGHAPKFSYFEKKIVKLRKRKRLSPEG